VFIYLVLFLDFTFFLLLVFLAVEFLLLPLVPIVLLAFGFVFDLVAFLVAGSTTSRLVELIGPGGVAVEGSVDSVDIYSDN
jgi:hypothetical protein